MSTARPDVQSAWIGGATMQWLNEIVPITARAEIAHVNSPNNQPSAGAVNYLRVQLVASYRFRYP